MAKLSWRIAPEPRADGSGDIAILIWGVDDAGEQLPGYEETIYIDARAIAAALAKPTKPQQLNAIIALIAERLNANKWGQLGMAAFESENAAATQAVADFETWRTAVLAMEYPLNFTLPG